jgi:hydroxymethylbilane synthase
MSTPIRIGTRGSQLALWQANHIAAELRGHGHSVEIEIIRTTGDQMQSQPEKAAGGKGIFIKEIEEALAAGRIDLAVHSCKDLPTELDPRFSLAAIPPRADARDAFVCEQHWALHMLPPGARIGTSSPRRRAQLLALRPDLGFVELRGNVDTRLRKLAEGEVDALVLAAAGLDRLARAEWVHQRFSPEELCPAPGQGALALEMRSAEHPLDTEDPSRDPTLYAAVRALNDPAAEFAVTTERVVLDALGGGCYLPIGAYCAPTAAGGWRMIAQVVAPDGEQMVTVDTEASSSATAQELGLWVGDALKAKGALELLA